MSASAMNATGDPVPEWAFLGHDWPAGVSGATGWDDASVAAMMLNALPMFIQVVTGTAPLGIYPLAPHVRSESGHNVSMTWGYVLARAAHGRSTLSVLDWGGALGHYALMAQRLVPEVTFEITIKERPELCRLGRELMPWVTFEDSDEACFARRYELVTASSSLQYVEDWRAMLGRFAQAAERWLFVTRVPIARAAPSFVVMHRPRAYGYAADYPSWVINRDELVAHVAALGWTLDREFISGQPTALPGAPEPSDSAGFLFRK
ncbi:MAG: hypothetical protein JO021_18135 [Alphaproteobacteria bacterium]|nr:hypothetical protein [Alphaproteobacteria bacterium]